MKFHCAKAGLVFVITALVLPILLGACPTPVEGEKEILRHYVPVSTVFNIGSKAYDGHAGNAGWLVEDPDKPGCYMLAPGGVHNQWNTNQEFPGVRLFNIDRDLPVKQRMDVSAYDGITFKYRTNMTNTEARLLDCMFWWAYASQDYFYSHNYRKGYANPDPELGYKELILPFYKMWKWGIPQNVSTPCNDTTKFQPQIFTNFRFDGRDRGNYNPDEGDVSPEAYWLEIVEFAFFNYQ